ncbi:MAG: glutamate--tRNA ligase, partial [Candidatus Staskawiczbacteria bacterium]|nr:glutamate--tRNA ligase [Candidatus Staskawiczbacteria bacterium]
MVKENIKIDKPIRVRIAPSPTGALHIGTARSALFNYLFAKKNNGKFILRIEDTDKERSELRWVQDIIDGLKWLGIEWDEGPDIDGNFGPYKQSQRNNLYEKYLKRLLDEDKAYHCFCTSEELEDKRQEQMSRGLAPKYDGTCAHLSKDIKDKKLKEKTPSVIRFRVENKKVKFNDLIRGDVEFDTVLMGDIIVAKNFETPLYNFTAVVDDFEMKISHVIRGEDHISNTPKQLLIQDALGLPHPEYGHLPLILAPDRSKMSKRFGAVSVTEYKEQGYLPEALTNFMALLGWNPGTEKEVFSLTQLSKEFSIEKVQKSGAIFNIQKLDSLNGIYIREKPIEKLTELCVPYLKEAGLLIVGQVTQNKLQEIIEVSKTRMKKLSDIVELSDFFFADKLKYDKNLLAWQKMGDSEIKDSLKYSEKIFSEIKKWDLKTLETELFSASEKFNLEKNYPEKNKG